MGTYFPRSFVESYKIFELLLKNRVISEHINNTQQIDILDIGSGTGGNLLGFLWFLKDQIYKSDKSNAEISLLSIDGDRKSLSTQKKLIEQFFGDCVSPHFMPDKFNSAEDFFVEINKILTNQAQKYDIIMSQ
jgi:SAM-dependent methyltransferase